MLPLNLLYFFYLGSSRASLLGLNNLSLVFLFIGFVYLVPHLSANKVVAFQPFYSTILFIEDPRPDYIAFFLCFTTLPYNFAPLPGSPSIYGPTPLYRLTSEVI